MLDLLGAIILLLLLGPAMMVVWLVVRAKLGSPAIFQQPRAGLYGRPFVLYKFRSMTDERDTEGNLLPNLMRISPFGRALRRSSLDELPQLWNVLKGEMSFVGPRPLLLEYVPLYSPEQRRRLEVKPGITGLAQIAGRNALDWDRRLELDVRYANEVTLGLDLWILLSTIKKVLKADGIPSTGLDPNGRFEGSSRNNKP